MAGKKRDDHPQTLNLSTPTLGIAKIENQWYIVKTMVDPEIGLAGDPELILAGQARNEAVERFKIMSAELEIV